MAPNKLWMNFLHDRAGEEYGRGVDEFLDYAFQRNGGNNEIRCPCVRCMNVGLENREVVVYHLRMNILRVKICLIIKKVALQKRLEDADLANERREKEINDLKAADDKREKEMQELKSMVLSLVTRMPQP